MKKQLTNGFVLINQNWFFESFAYVTFTLKSKKTSSFSKDHMQWHMTKGYYLNEI
jgi:hypothetical protein